MISITRAQGEDSDIAPTEDLGAFDENEGPPAAVHSEPIYLLSSDEECDEADHDAEMEDEEKPRPNSMVADVFFDVDVYWNSVNVPEHQLESFLKHVHLHRSSLPVKWVLLKLLVLAFSNFSTQTLQLGFLSRQYTFSPFFSFKLCRIQISNNKGRSIQTELRNYLKHAVSGKAKFAQPGVVNAALGLKKVSYCAVFLYKTSLKKRKL
jgi:hypothetical protein